MDKNGFQRKKKGQHRKPPCQTQIKCIKKKHIKKVIRTYHHPRGRNNASVSKGQQLFHPLNTIHCYPHTKAEELMSKRLEL